MDKKTKLYILIVLGLIISIYLTIIHFQPSALVCPSVGIVNCENVLTSSYSNIFGVPVAVLGLVLFILAPLMLVVRGTDTMTFLWSLAGAAAVLYSLITQTIIGSVCLYCLSLDLVILLTLYVANRKPKQS